MILLVMGVSGVGKTSVGEGVAAAMGWPYVEGDALHPPENVAKMAGGTPLNDADRLPWLRAIAAQIDAWRAAGSPGVVSCSALKRSYRDLLLGGREGVRLVYLEGDKDVIGARLAARRGHFMPPGLLESQFGTLEVPTADENPLVVDVRPPTPVVIESVIAGLQQA